MVSILNSSWYAMRTLPDEHMNLFNSVPADHRTHSAKQNGFKLGVNSRQILCIMVFCLVLGGSHSQGQASCIELVQTKCIDCHFETRICQKLKKKKGKSSWKRTIKSMVRHGTKLSKAEHKELVQCFVKRDSKVLSFCGINK